MGDVWPTEKRQLLIDSILNGYDIPKLYFHEFFPAREINGKKYKYAIVDGKQRLQTIFSFIDGQFTLDKDIEIIADQEIKPGGLTYADLARKYPDLKTQFDGFVLPIISILTEDTELIEDMFSRLNEAVPLNAAEKRNALGGPVPRYIREITGHNFFTKKLPFNNKRYRHYDVATKFLYITQRGILADTKKIHLDEFVKSHRENNTIEAVEKLAIETIKTLDKMAVVFTETDWLLRSAGTTVLYYFLFLDGIMHNWIEKITRADLDNFESIRLENRRMAEENSTNVNFNLLEYDRLIQSPNDAVALRFRYSVLRQYIGSEQGRPELIVTI